MTQKIKIAVLISGGGSNLKALIDASKAGDYPAEIVCVASNRPDAGGLRHAEDAGIPAHIVNHKEYDGREAFDEALIEVLAPYGVGLVCLAGFMRILTPRFIDAYEGRILNTHPSLLPKFGGEGMYGMHVHSAVIDAGESVSGVTIHKVISEVDRGEIVLQREVRVEDKDTPDALAARVLREEHIGYPLAVKAIAEKMLNF
ncbi:MAG: phosphoribosylglycinamide formyltransferase [Alphaproteobacteria bacterium]